MKSWTWSALALAGLLLTMAVSVADATTVAPPARGTLVIGAIGGLTLPQGALDSDIWVNGRPIAEKFDMGWNGGGTADWFLNEQFALGATVGTGVLKNSEFSDIQGSTTLAVAHVKYYPRLAWPVRPYAVVGAGWYGRHGEGSAGGVFASATDNSQGFLFGLGADRALDSRFGLGVHVTYHNTSGAFEPTVEGHEVRALDDWRFVLADLQLTYRFDLAKK
jgi:hypothetical protein